VIGGVPRIYVWGEQYFAASNKQMTYGDALEGCKSNAILRAGKELGIAREMWSKGHLADLKSRLLGQGEGDPQRMRSTRSSGRQQPEAPPANHHAQSGEKITDKQRQRLWVITRNSGRSDEEVAGWLRKRYQLQDSREITRRDYDAICRAIEAQGDLP
jgi:hypothetical protein